MEHTIRTFHMSGIPDIIMKSKCETAGQWYRNGPKYTMPANTNSDNGTAFASIPRKVWTNPHKCAVEVGDHRGDGARGRHAHRSFCADSAQRQKYASPASKYKMSGDSGAGFDPTQNWALEGRTTGG